MERSDQLWRKIINHDFDSELFSQFLIAVRLRLPEGSFGAALGDALRFQADGESPLVLHLKEFTTWRQTTRIDGVLPIDIPVAISLEEMTHELLKHLWELQLPSPAQPKLLQDELGLSYLAILHGCKIHTSHGLRLDLAVECPQSGGSASRRPELSLMGYLPFGHRITVFYSSYRASHHSELKPDAVECAERLEAIRSGQDNGLRLVRADSVC